MSARRRSSKGCFDRFLFASADSLSVAVFRIILAATLAANFWKVGDVTRSIDATAWLGTLYHSIFLSQSYHALCVVLIVLLAVGLWPRPIGFLLVALLAPLDFLSIGQQSRQILLFALFAFSFLFSNRRLALRLSRIAEVPEASGPIWPMRLIQIQLSLVYGINALAKTTPAYLSGAVLIGLSRMLPNFRGNLSEGFLHLGPIAIPVVLAACVSVAIEYMLAVGFWFQRLRWPTAALGIAFHLVLASVLRIYMLDWTSVAMYPAFLLPFDRTRHIAVLKSGSESDARPRLN